MLEQWSIESSPTLQDSKRHTLFLKAEKLEVYAFLREFGDICGRPQKTSKENYSYSLVLHRVGPQDLQKIEKFLISLSKNESAVTAPPILPRSEAPLAPNPDILIRREKPIQAPAAPPAEDIHNGPLTNEPLYGATFTPNPLWNLDALVVGPFNRFAHAAATAVISNPGSIYNPLLLFGTPGVGKSHFLAAIGYSLQKGVGRDPVFFTTGPKLSQAVDLAAAQDKMGELLSHAQGSAGLLIDDVHLMTFSERNQAGLKSIVHHYLDANKPVVMTSVYPPRALQFIEEALGFEIGSGYAVEIKLAGPDVQLQILRAVTTRLGFKTDDEELIRLREVLGQSFLKLNRWLRRIRTLKVIRSARGETTALKDLLALLLAQPEKVPSAPLSAQDVTAALTQLSPLEISTAPEAKIAGLVFPTDHENYAKYMLLQFRDGAKRAGLNLALKTLAAQSYDPNQLYGVPAAIGEACKRSGASAVLMLGPMPRTQLSAHEEELNHALDHILANLKISFTMIPFLPLPDPTIYLHSILDVYFGLWAPWQP